MMKGKSGEVLWDDTIRLGVEIRKKIRALGQEFKEKAKGKAQGWFFDPFVADVVETPRGPHGVGGRCRPTISPKTRPIGPSSPARTGTASAMSPPTMP